MVYPIVIYGHPILRKVAEDIDRDYPELDQVIADLFETLYRSEGLGLAAPQIGKSIRIFVIDGKPVGDDEPELADFKKVFINAHVTEKSGDLHLMTEGCLSIPNLREEINRESHIRINYYDENCSFMMRYLMVIKHGSYNMNMITSTVSPLLTKSACLKDC
jgi:peptide deformylase